MIDFACKNFNLNEIFKCALGLTKADLEILKYFIRNNLWLKTEDISESLKFNLSTVQRAVKKLYEKEMITRTQKNLEQGGYYFEYRIKGKEHIKKIIMAIINSWVSNVESEINNCKWN